MHATQNTVKQATLCSSVLCALLFCVSLHAAEAPAVVTTPAQPTVPASTEALGEDPGPLYTQVVLLWAKATNFAQNAAQEIVAKFTSDMQKNPKLQDAMTPELAADLEQFFYELFLSPDMIRDLARVYAQFFTIEDLQDIIKFYKSPVGLKLVKNEPQLKIKTQQIGEDLVKKYEKQYMLIISKHIVPNPKSH